MSLKARIEDDFKQALRKQEAGKLSCLRMIKAAVKNKEIDLRKPLEDVDLLGLLATMAKQRKESIEMFQKGGREDLAIKESAELALIESYMPTPLTEAEIFAMIDQAIQETGAQGAKDMGKVMQKVTPQTKGRADGKIVSELVKKKLS